MYILVLYTYMHTHTHAHSYTLFAILYNSQIITGDQLTCKNIRGAKRWVQSEIDPLFRLKWANESPGKHVNSVNTVVLT